MKRKIIKPVAVAIVGSSGYIELQPGCLVCSTSDSTIFKISDPEYGNVKVRIFEDTVGSSTSSVDETQQESERRVLEILRNETLLAACKKIETDPSIYMKDLGSESLWPYMHNAKWLHALNRKLKHPSLTIETRKMLDGWHLVAILHQDW